MAGKGTSTFVMQRASAILLLPLVAWFLYSVAAHAGDSYLEARAWAARPVNLGLLGLFITIGAFHMRIGMMEIIEDYIHDGLKGPLNLLNWAVAILVTVITWWSLIANAG